MYFSRINSQNINQLIKEAYSLNKRFTCANSIFDELELDKDNFIDTEKSFREVKILENKDSKRK